MNENIIETEPENYNVSVTYNSGGKVLINNEEIVTKEVTEGQSVTFTILPDNGYEIDKVIFNEIDVTAQLNNNNFITKINQASILEVSFKDIETAITLINKENISIRPVYNGIAIETQATTPVTVYNLYGQKVYQSVVTGKAEISLDKGVYIVRVNNESEKVIVK
jgi:hypothetical protein